MESTPQATEEPDFKNARRKKMTLADPLRTDRLPPHSIESEQAVLGCILLDPQASLPLCVSKLTGAEAFYDLRHRTIYEQMVRMQDERLQVELISLMQELGDAKLLEGVGGLAYLSSLPDATPSASNIDYYLSVLCEKHTMRKLINLCAEVVSRAYAHEGEVDELVDQVERDMHAITTAAQSSDQMQTAKELIKDTISQIERQFERKGQVGGIATGFPDFDRLTGGLQDGDLIVIAARPSMGKTSFAMNIAEHVALELKLPVGVASLEMTRRSLMMRLVCSVARISSNDVRDGNLKERDFSKLTTAAGRLNTRSLVIDDSSGLSILQLKARARRMHQQHGIKLLIIDYLQLLHSTSKKADNRQQEVSDVSGGAKQIAKELNIPVVILAQLNREIEKNGNRKPRLSDLRESGCLSADTRIYGNKISRIDKLTVDADGERELFCVGMNNAVTKAPLKSAWKTGMRQTFKMVLSTGHTVCATANHKFYGFGNRWIPLSELRVGDQIAIALNAPLAKTETISMAEARLLGLFLSNGCTLPRRSTQITLNAGDMDLAKLAIKDAKNVFDGALRSYAKVEKPSTRVGHEWINVFFPSKRVPSKVRRSDLTTWLMKFGLWDVRAKQKKVPAQIFEQPKNIVMEFLSALFSGDGTTGIQVKEANGKSTKHQYQVASYSSSSRELVDGVQWLLQCLGIVSGISTVNCRGFTSYILSVYSRGSKLKFAEQVGFLSRRKDDEMKRVVSKMLSAPLGWEKYIPDGDLAFIPIKSITPIGVEEVWDAEVPGTHNFVANGIVAHNSIEQDADVVGLLYKPQQDEEGDAPSSVIPVNLLIAKQRNGPTGEIQLAFLKHFTRFESAARHTEPSTPYND